MPTCSSVRDLLPEFAFGVLGDRERVLVERHLEWCAGCRKESAELAQGAATLAFALPAASPPAGLDDRIVGALASAMRGHGSTSTGRRARAAVASTIAAMVAVGGLGWGAVMAGRAERSEARATAEQQARLRDLAEFRRLIDSFTSGARVDEDHAYLGQLNPVGPDHQGGGAVLQLVSPTMLDFVIVRVNNLPTDPELAPYRIVLQNAAGEELRAGRIDEVDQVDGTGEAFHEFKNADLTGYTNVIVRDALGDVVLRGTIVPDDV